MPFLDILPKIVKKMHDRNHYSKIKNSHQVLGHKKAIKK